MGRRRATVDPELLERFRPLLWSWPAREDVSGEGVALKSRLLTFGPDDGEATPFWVLSAADRERGERLERQHGDGMASDRATDLRPILERLKARGVRVDAVGVALAEARRGELRTRGFSDGMAEFKGSVSDARARLRTLERAVRAFLRPATRTRGGASHFSPGLTRALEAALTVVEAEKAEAAALFRDGPRHRPAGRNRWRPRCEKALGDLGVSEDDARALLMALGLSKPRPLKSR